jgi:hypothetical protein
LHQFKRFIMRDGKIAAARNSNNKFQAKKNPAWLWLAGLELSLRGRGDSVKTVFGNTSNLIDIGLYGAYALWRAAGSRSQQLRHQRTCQTRCH